MKNLETALSIFDDICQKFKQTPPKPIAVKAKGVVSPAKCIKAEERGEKIEKFAAMHRQYGYGYFLEVANSDDFLIHEEWCKCECRYDDSVGWNNVVAGYRPLQHYWRAFKCKDDAAEFMIYFEATNLLPEIDFNDDEW